MFYQHPKIRKPDLLKDPVFGVAGTGLEPMTFGL